MTVKPEKLSEAARQFDGVEKGPRRVFSREEHGGSALYCLPNGICIFERADTDLEEGRTYAPVNNSAGFPFPFKVVEIGDGKVIIKRPDRE